MLFSSKKYFFLFLHKNLYCGYSLEVPRRGSPSRLELCDKIFVCAEVLQLSQPIGVMSSMVSLPNYTFSLGRLSLLGSSIVLVHILSPEADHCPSWKGGTKRMTVGSISSSITMEECCRNQDGSNLRLPDIQLDMHLTEPPRLACDKMPHSADLYLLLARAYLCLCWGFMAQSTQWGHVERGQFT